MHTNQRNTMDEMQHLHKDLVEAYAHVLGGPGPDTISGGPAPLPATLNGMRLDEAYAFQRATIGGLLETWGTSFAGYKISATNSADQALIDATEPTSGILTDSHLLPSGASVELESANHPLVEPELAMRVVVDIAPGATLDELAASVECAGALEVPISRFAGWWPPGEAPGLNLSGLVADNSVAGYVVLGDTWRTLKKQEIASLRVRLERPSAEPVKGTAERVLGHPLHALAWLVDRLARGGERLTVGAVVSTGTFIAPSRAEIGTYKADFGPALGPVVVDFIKTR